MLNSNSAEIQLQPTDRRFQVQQGLEQLVARGRAAEFQDLAFHVLRTRYPALILSEASHDGGEDAFVLPAAEADADTPILAASFTASLAKVKHDCSRLKERQVRPHHLCFVTPKSVRRTDIDKWKETVKREFGHGLEVIEKAGLVAELERPELSWLCREYLGIADPVNGDVASIAARAREAADKHVHGWEIAETAATRGVRLTIRSKDGETPSNAGSSDAVEMLAGSARGARQLLVFGPPGGGKTVTLIQVARALLRVDGPIPVLVSALEWSLKSLSLVDLVSAELGLKVDELGALDEIGRIAVLINGWNEIPERGRVSTLSALDGFMKRLSKTSILVATREGTDGPRLPRAEVLQLEPLSRGARRELVLQSALVDSAALLGYLERDEALDVITRTPLFLSVAIQVAARSKMLPKSLWALFEQFAVDVESGEHSALLEEACRSQHRTYLSALGARLTEEGGAGLPTAEVLQVIANTSIQLLEQGLVGQVPDAMAVLRALTAHHLLVTTGGPSGTVRFQHQQFQAWAAAEWLRREVAQVRRSGSSTEVASLQRNVLDRPGWSDAVLLLMDSLDQVGAVAANPMAADLLTWLFALDPLFAATCSRAGGDSAWAVIGGPLGETFRLLHGRASEEEQSYAVTGMLATARPQFGDVVWPLLESDDSQVRLATLRAWRPFSIRALGPAWRERCSKWPEARRAELLAEILFFGRADERDDLLEFAAADVSPVVRAEAAETLAFVGDRDGAMSLLNADPSLWAQPQGAHLVRELNADEVRKLEPTLQSVLESSSIGLGRWPLLEAMAEAGSRNAIEALKATCAEASPEHLFNDVVPLLLRLAPEWTISMLLDRIERDELVADVALAQSDRDLRDRVRSLVEKLLQSQRPRHASQGGFALLLQLSPAVASATVICAYREALHREGGSEGSSERAFGQRCEDLLDCLSTTERCTSVLALEDFPRDEGDVEVFHRLFTPTIPMQLRAVEGLSEAQLGSLRELVLRGYEVISPSSRYVRGLRSHLATLLGLFGGPDDATTILQWAGLDETERLRQSAASEPGAGMVYANWYAGAFVRLGTPSAVTALEGLLQDIEYFGPGSLALAALAAPSSTNEPYQWGPPDYRLMKKRQPLHSTEQLARLRGDQTKRLQRAVEGALLLHLDLADSGGAAPRPYSFGEAARALGQFGASSAVPLLLRLGRRPGCEWGVIDGLESLALLGASLPGQETADVVESIIQRVVGESAMSNHDPWWFVIRCLSLLLVSDSPDLGVEAARRVLPRLASHHIRDMMAPLAASSSPSALGLLLELLEAPNSNTLWYPEAIAAVAEFSDHGAQAGLFGILDGALGNDARTLSHDSGRALVKALGALGRKDERVFVGIEKRAHQVISSRDRDLLASILREVGTDVAARAACGLLRDDSANPIPSGVRRLVEDSIHWRRPAEQHGVWYVDPKPAAHLRAHLFSLTGDPARRNSARRLLLMIEQQRSETGRPRDEGRYPGRLGSVPPVATWTLP